MSSIREMADQSVVMLVDANGTAVRTVHATEHPWRES